MSLNISYLYHYQYLLSLILFSLYRHIEEGFDEKGLTLCFFLLLTFRDTFLGTKEWFFCGVGVEVLQPHLMCFCGV